MELISVLTNALLIGMAIFIVVLLISYILSKTSGNSVHEENHNLVSDSQQQTQYYQPQEYYGNQYGSVDYYHENREPNYYQPNHYSNNGSRRSNNKPIEHYEVDGIRVTHITYGMDREIESRRPKLRPRPREEYFEDRRNRDDNQDNYYPSRTEYSRPPEDDEDYFRYESNASNYKPHENKYVETNKPAIQTKRYTIVNKPVITNISEGGSSNAKPIHLMSTQEFLRASFK